MKKICLEFDVEYKNAINKRSAFLIWRILDERPFVRQTANAYFNNLFLFVNIDEEQS